MKSNRQPEEEKVEPLRVRERVEVNEKDGYMKQYLDALLRHGGMFSAAQAGRMLGVSTQRVSKLVMEGRLPLVEVVFPIQEAQEVVLEELIPGNALRQYQEQRGRKGGRGMKAPAIPADAMAA